MGEDDHVPDLGDYGATNWSQRRHYRNYLI